MTLEYNSMLLYELLLDLYVNKFSHADCIEPG